MTRVDFYILSSDDPAERLHYACKVTEKAYKLGHRVYVNSQNADQAQQLNDLLWSFLPSSFIPHTGITDSIDCPVLIGHDSLQVDQETSPETRCEVLVNLADNVPEFFSRFQRVSEIVVQHAHIKQVTRDNYRFYRHRGYPLHTHNIGH